MTNIKLSDFAGGAVDERFNIELEEVLKNINDLNTDPSKKRKITITVTMTGNDERNLSSVLVEAKTVLVPAMGISSTLLLDHDEKGKPVAAELKSGIPGQSFISEQGEVLDDKGQAVLSDEEIEKSSKVVNFK